MRFLRCVAPSDSLFIFKASSVQVDWLVGCIYDMSIFIYSIFFFKVRYFFASNYMV